MVAEGLARRTYLPGRLYTFIDVTGNSQKPTAKNVPDVDCPTLMEPLFFQLHHRKAPKRLQMDISHSTRYRETRLAVNKDRAPNGLEACLPSHLSDGSKEPGERTLGTHPCLLFSQHHLF